MSSDASTRPSPPRRVWKYLRDRPKRFIIGFLILAHLSGALTSVQAIMATRTPQGAIAWAISLNTMPVVALPAYWIFGRSRFEGYINKRRLSLERTDPLVREFVESAKAHGFTSPEETDLFGVKERLAKLPATNGNSAQLLINGHEIFDSILAGIDTAEDYILTHFYIVRDDELGTKYKDHLLAAAARGVRVYFMYDEIGSFQLSSDYLDALRDGGVEITPFNSTRGLRNQFQINFRNHRKIVITDGRAAWVGGTNVGDEYLHRHPELTPWIETMVRLQGPVVQAVQVAFTEDWNWATGAVLDVEWSPAAAPDGESLPVLCVPSGPADTFETCALYFLSSIHSAQRRFWVASPYFVPDEQIVSALQLAALRGVDVRVVVADECDAELVRLAGWSYVEPLERAGVRLYRHENGFMHHKIMVVDDDTAAVGTANFDNRSFRLNFEITIEVRDEDFTSQVADLFVRDFEDSRLATTEELESRPFPVRFAVRFARLLAPIL